MVLKADRSDIPWVKNPIYRDVPWWRQDIWEHIDQTLKREIQEETWIQPVTIGKYLGTCVTDIEVIYSDRESYGLILTMYLITVQWDPGVVLSHEHIAYERVEKEVFLERMQLKYPPEYLKNLAEKL